VLHSPQILASIRKAAVVVAPTFTTWNPAEKSSNIGLSGSNLIATNSSTAFFEGVRSVASHSTGKYYWEITINSDRTGHIMEIGVANGTWPLTSGSGTDLGSDNDGVGFSGVFLKLNSSTSFIQDFAQFDIVGIALDLTNSKLWFVTITGGVASNWNNSGTDNPATNTGGFDISTMNAGPYFAAATCKTVGTNITANFGASTYAIVAALGSVPSGFVNL
jgi:hypothetical protein